MAFGIINNLISQPNVCRCCLSAGGEWDITTSYLSADGKKEVYSEILKDCFGISLSIIKNISLSLRVCQLCVEHLREASSFKKQVLNAEKVFKQYYDIHRDVAKPLGNTLKEDDNLICGVNSIEGSGQYKVQNSVKELSERKRLIVTCETVLKWTTACPFRHHKSWFQCFYCTDDFMEIAKLREHTAKAHNNTDDELKKIKRFPRSLQIDISNLKCCQCELNLVDVEAMRRHLAEAHNRVLYKECIADYKVNTSPYTCHLCGKRYHVFRSLTTHLNVHYANCVCDVCGKSFMNTKRLKVHRATHENGHYPCSECGKVLKTKISKANHMGTHAKRVLKCHICFEPMKHYNDRLKHMSERHNVTHKFVCPVCGREFNLKHYLATHVRQTHGNRNKACPDCGMTFKTNYGLKKHMLRHSGIRAFKCSVCCKTYARSYTLREHLRTHESEGVATLT
uniref:Uncharacterized protein n=1 Tax=Bombyx mori TaxID=7091 RepID=A0A8R2RAI9_BOMMO|nr:zinc finger protein 710 isoform X4 [Bombyx mori]